MSRYFTLVDGDYYTPKNNLHKEVREYILANDRLIIENRVYMEAVAQIVLDTIAIIEARHPRCNPLRIDVQDGNREGQTKVIRVFHVAALNFYEEKDLEVNEV